MIHRNVHINRIAKHGVRLYMGLKNNQYSSFILLSSRLINSVSLKLNSELDIKVKVRFIPK